MKIRYIIKYEKYGCYREHDVHDILCVVTSDLSFSDACLHQKVYTTTMSGWAIYGTTNTIGYKISADTIVFFGLDSDTNWLKMTEVNAFTYDYVQNGYKPNPCGGLTVQQCVDSVQTAITHWTTSSKNTDYGYLIDVTQLPECTGNFFIIEIE